MRMRTVIEIQNISRFTPVNATMSAAPFSASAMLAARMPSVRVRSPMAPSGRLAIDSEAVSSVATERGASARSETSTIRTSARSVLRICRLRLVEACRLQGVHPRVAAVGPRNQLGMGAVLDHPAAFDHDDAVGTLDRREAVGDDYGRHTARELDEALVDLRFAAHVE